LLPTLLESNVPRTYAAGLSAERGTGERYDFVAAEDPAMHWLVTINPDALEVTRGSADDGEADLTISAPAVTLALLVYGRADLGTCGATLEGDRRQVDRFAKIFPRP
jgi:predicted lipid carrier protein YhbT